MGDEGAQSLKIVLLGDSGVGKTSIVNYFVTGGNPGMTKPTVGAAFVNKPMPLDGQQFDLLIWDTSGQEIYRGLAPMYYRNASIALIVYDITKSKSFEAVDYWIGELQKNLDENVVILIIGNKVDLEQDRQVDAATAENWATNHEAMFIETSAQTGSQIDRAFQMCVKKFVNTSNPSPPAAGASQGVKIDDKGSQNGKGKCC